MVQLWSITCLGFCNNLGQEGWREAPGWLFQNLIHLIICAFGAATPPVQEGQWVFKFQSDPR
jgi:hypothetical protein